MSLSCDYEMPTVYRWSEPVARKAHKCVECRSDIHIGEKHFYVAGVWGGEFSTYRQHTLCCAACMHVRDSHPDGECIPFGYLMDWIQDYRGGDPVMDSMIKGIMERRDR